MNITLPEMRRKAAAIPWGKEIADVIVTALLSCAEFSGVSPAGLAYAAAMPAKSKYGALLGLCMGAVLSRGKTVKYIPAFLIYYLLVYMKKSADKRERAVFAGISAAVAGAADFVRVGFSVYGAVMLVPTAVLCGAMYLCALQSGNRGIKGCFADLVLAGTVLNGFTGVTLPYINVKLSVLCAFLLLMSIGYACGAPYAASAGLIIGIIMCTNSPDCALTLGMALGAGISSVTALGDKAGTAAGFVCGITLCLLWGGSLGDLGLADIFLPFAVFVLVPERVHGGISAAIARRTETDGTNNTRDSHTAHRLRMVAKAVSDLADGVSFAPNREKIGAEKREMLNAVTARVCRGCHMEKNCRKNGEKMRKSMIELWETMENEGFCDYGNMPGFFRQVCMRSERFLGEFRHMYELYKQGVLHRGEMLSERDVVVRQYGEISNAIKMLSHELESEEKEYEAGYRAEVTAAQEPKAGQTVCGDELIYFEQKGRFYAILCDGMGCGEAAHAESRLTARLFAELLKAGFEKTAAVNMINSAMALKADKESFSTADLLEIDLETGACEFLKIGSAQSFAVTAQGAEALKSTALPIGILECVEVAAIKRELKDGDAVLMMSDGVGEAGSGVAKNEWIKRTLALKNRTDGELVNLIIAGAKARTSYSDDMTAVLIRIRRAD